MKKHGWYQWWSIWKDNYKNRAQEVFDEGADIGMAVVTLDASQDVIPQPLIDTMYRNMRDARDVGLMSIVRFRYGDKAEDAPTERVVKHIQQLKHFLHEFNDIILTLHAGFIGHYGEWHYSDWLRLEVGKTHLCHNITPNARRTITHALFENTPFEMIISFRTPAIIQELDDARVLVTGRVGFHNDALWSSGSEMGTWVPKTEPGKSTQQTYLRNICSMFGGETAALYETNMSPSLVFDGMRRLPYQYISGTHRDAVIAHWKNHSITDMVRWLMKENAR